MKVLIIFAINCILNLTILFPVFAAINISSTNNFHYNLINDTNTLDGNLNFSNKLNVNATGYATIKYATATTTTTSTTPPFPTNVSFTNTVSIDSCYVTYKTTSPDIGTFTVGTFSHALGNLYTLSSAIADLKSYLGIKWEKNFANNLTIKTGVFPWELTLKQSTFTAGLDYTSNNFGSGLNLVKPEDYDLGYTVNVYFKPINQFKIYLHYGIDQTKDTEEILGLLLNLPPAAPFVFSLEYNFDNQPVDSNQLGYRAVYIIDKNIALSYNRAFMSTPLNELRLTATF